VPERRSLTDPSFSEPAQFDESLLSRAPEWHRRAACSGVTWVDWFPSRRRFEANHGTDAKSVCVTCPVLVDCLTGAIERHEDFGIWGGAGGGERKYMRRLFVKRPHVEPGLVAGCECGWCSALAGWRDRLRVDLAPRAERAARVEPVVNRNGPGARHGLRVSY
jgi:WhiB family redox-sensing transcriptional regulator